MAARSERVLVEHVFTNFPQASEAYKSVGSEGWVPMKGCRGSYCAWMFHCRPRVCSSLLKHIVTPGSNERSSKCLVASYPLSFWGGNSDI